MQLSVRIWMFVSLLAASRALIAFELPDWGSLGATVESDISMEFKQGFTDNLVFQPEGEEVSAIQFFKPKAELALLGDVVETSLVLDYERAEFDGSRADAYSDYSANLVVRVSPSLRNRIQLNAAYLDKHEARGTDFSRGLLALTLDSPDTYKDQSFGFRYSYGAEGARGRVLFSVTNWGREYTSRPDVTFVRNRDELQLSSAFVFELAPNIQAVIEARHSGIKYDGSPGPSLSIRDSEDARYYLGLRWNATGKTEGDIRVGQAYKNFDAPDREDFSGFSWEGSISWLPRTYSNLSLAASRQPREFLGFGSFIISEKVNLSWSHAWSERLDSELFYTALSDDYQGEALEIDGDLQQHSLGFRVDFDLFRAFTVAASVKRSSQSARIQQFEYDENQVALHLLLGGYK